MAERIPLDPGMKMTYVLMHDIDPDELIPMEQPFREYAIALNGGCRNLLDFLNESSRVVTLDQFSTRDLASMLEKYGGEIPPEHVGYMKRAFIELTTANLLLEHSGKSIGIARSTQLYNGLAGIINCKDIVRAIDPIRLLDEKTKMVSPEKVISSFGTPPLTYTGTDVGLHPDFLAEHPVTKIRA